MRASLVLSDYLDLTPLRRLDRDDSVSPLSVVLDGGDCRSAAGTSDTNEWLPPLVFSGCSDGVRRRFWRERGSATGRHLPAVRREWRATAPLPEARSCLGSEIAAGPSGSTRRLWALDFEAEQAARSGRHPRRGEVEIILQQRIVVFKLEVLLRT